MGISGSGDSRQGADIVIQKLKEQPEFLQWDREINGKLYYALWILFMGGFVLSIGYSNQPDLFSNCLIRPLLHAFRLLAVIGSVLNFLFQSRAIDAVRHARALSIQMDLHKALADDNKPEDAKKALDQAQKLNDKLIEETVKLGGFKSKQDAVNTALEEYVHRRKRLGILKLGGQIDFDPNWDYKGMRRNRR